MEAASLCGNSRVGGRIGVGPRLASPLARCRPSMEGRHLARGEAKRGPTPILPPTLEFPHSEAASITGGYVYHGKRYPDLAGAYICGDWVTGKIWATRFDGDK